MGTEDQGLGKLTPPDHEEVKLQPEEENLLKNPSQYKHIAGIVTSQKNNIRNIIASVIEDREDVIVVLDDEDCVGIRSVVARVHIERNIMNSDKLNSIASMIIEKLKKAGYSASDKPSCGKFRCSSKPIKGEL